MVVAEKMIQKSTKRSKIRKKKISEKIIRIGFRSFKSMLSVGDKITTFSQANLVL